MGMWDSIKGAFQGAKQKGKQAKDKTKAFAMKKMLKSQNVHTPCFVSVRKNLQRRFFSVLGSLLRHVVVHARRLDVRYTAGSPFCCRE